MRAEPKIETAGVGILATASNPLVNSSAIWRTRSWSAPSSLSRMRRSSIRLEVFVYVARAHGEDQKGREAEVGGSHGDPLPRPHAVIRRRLGILPLLPAAPNLESAQDEYEEQDRIRPKQRETQ